MDILGIVGIAVGVAGLIFGLVEHSRRVKLDVALRTQFSTSLNRVRALVTYNDDIVQITEGLDSPKITKWVWSTNKGLSDLYVSMVGYYIASHPSFTYDDIKNCIESGIITTAWEEQNWREHVAVRKENKGTTPPEAIIKDNSNRRYIV